MARATKNSLNNPSTTLSAAISIGASSAPVVSVSDFPATGTFSVNIGNSSADQEVIDCSVSGSDIVFVGTTTKAHASGAPVNIVWSRADYDNFFRRDYDNHLTQINDLDPSIGDYGAYFIGTNQASGQSWTFISPIEMEYYNPIPATYDAGKFYEPGKVVSVGTSPDFAFYTCIDYHDPTTPHDPTADTYDEEGIGTYWKREISLVSEHHFYSTATPYNGGAAGPDNSGQQESFDFIIPNNAFALEITAVGAGGPGSGVPSGTAAGPGGGSGAWITSRFLVGNAGGLVIGMVIGKRRAVPSGQTTYGGQQGGATCVFGQLPDLLTNVYGSAAIPNYSGAGGFTYYDTILAAGGGDPGGGDGHMGGMGGGEVWSGSIKNKTFSLSPLGITTSGFNRGESIGTYDATYPIGGRGGSTPFCPGAAPSGYPNGSSASYGVTSTKAPGMEPGQATDPFDNQITPGGGGGSGAANKSAGSYTAGGNGASGLVIIKVFA